MIESLVAAGEVMGLVVLAKGDLGNRLPEPRRTLRDFPPGRRANVCERYGIGGFKRVEPAEFEKLDRCLPATLRWLNEEQRELRKTNDASDHHDDTQADQRDQGIYKQTARPA